ncbi:MAG: hypothetical protein SFV54_18155 [Bryobacteraceae bacterium]|nr:hypothetical protein [Bryobacteraceae bacterium]
MKNALDTCQSSGASAITERPRFFARQLVTPDDLTLLNDYLRDRLRRLTRFVLGWGVVCGAKVSRPDPVQPWKVIIEPGYILGPYGDEILLDRRICFDVRVNCFAALTGDPCSDAELDTGGCGSVLSRPAPKGDLYIAVRYKEYPSRPVRVQPSGCGCDETRCEYSRWRDGYEICVIDHCPPGHAPRQGQDNTRLQVNPECPECPSEPWVVLAKVTVADDGSITVIDNCACRRIVTAPASVWRTCNEEPNRPQPQPPDPRPNPPTPNPPTPTPTPNPTPSPNRPVPDGPRER